MGKIFDALQRDGDSVLPSLFEKLGEAVPAEASAPAAPLLVERPAVTETAIRAGVDLSAVATVPVRIAAGTPLLPFDQANPAAEQYRMLRTKLTHHPISPRMIVMSSSGSGDGKSVSSINLAAAMALRSDTKTILIDADFRRHTINEYLGLETGPGLADVLEGRVKLEDALIRVEQLPSLYVLQAGVVKSNSAELLDGDAWRKLCKELPSIFRFMLIDSPPVGVSADYELLETVADGVLVIVRPDHTERSLCQNALETVDRSKLLGIVLNCNQNWFLYRKTPGYGDYAYGDRS